MHLPVLQNEVLEFLKVKPNQNFIDATVGEGGHALAILERNGPKGKVLGIDRDPEVIKELEHKVFEERLITAQGNFANLKKIVKEKNFKDVSGILFDLGLCSWHLEKSGRGFSFKKDEPLDMRFNPKQELTAKEIVNSFSKEEIETILKEYGEEKHFRKIAKAIVKKRKESPIETTSQLIEAIKGVIPNKYQRGRIHFATRTFQALRIAVNNELENLKQGLKQASEVVNKEGRIVAISFHSLEDRIVKRFFKNNLKVLTKKPITPTKEEIKTNPRSRSAKLRASIKL